MRFHDERRHGALLRDGADETIRLCTTEQIIGVHVLLLCFSSRIILAAKE
jgi:hypothetical protein